ncbi:MAG: tRNA lysidine(34) synthetase TilS [Candidatus Hydrogenedentota bacterium]
MGKTPACLTAQFGTCAAVSSPSTTLVDQAASTIASHQLLRAGEKVLVACSGGADSVACLSVLRELGYALHVVHFNHRTRGAESEADCNLAADLAFRWGLPFHVISRPVLDEAEAAGESFENYARRARYAAFLDIARETGCAALATGHHQGDQAETVLMRLLRGSGMRGLAGIPPGRTEQGVRIIRPLLDCSREDIKRYLRYWELPWREDASNASNAYTRNRLRHEILPLLRKSFNPSVEEALARTAACLRDDGNLLREQAESLLRRCRRSDHEIDRQAFAQAHPALQRRAIVLLAERYGVTPAFERVEEARHHLAHGATGASCDVGGQLLLRNGRRTAEFVAPGSGMQWGVRQPVHLACPGETVAFGKRFRTRWLPRLPAESLKTYCHPGRQVFDAAHVAGPLIVRPRQPGDRFRPFGMEGRRKVKDYLGGLGLTPSQRETQLVLTDGEGILWIVGRAISGDAAAGPHTQTLLEVEVDDASM